MGGGVGGGVDTRPRHGEQRELAVTTRTKAASNGSLMRDGRWIVCHYQSTKL